MRNYLFVLMTALCVALPAFAVPPLVDNSRQNLTNVVNVLKFVTFPKDIQQSPKIVLCVLGKNPFGSALDEVNKAVGQKPIRLIADIAPDFSKYCHVVYISESESYRLFDLVTALKGKPLLTISNTEGFALMGGMIEMRHGEGNKVTFAANRKAAEAEGLRISAKLLTLGQ